MTKNLFKKIFIIFVSVLILVLILFVYYYNKGIILKTKLLNEIENTKTIYSQCVLKIVENHKEAENYTNDLIKISKQAKENLEVFNNQVFTWLHTRIIPKVSPELRTNVQKTIDSCRNQYLATINYNLLPLYNNYNIMIKKFPNNIIYNILGFKSIKFQLPQSITVLNSFQTGIDTNIIK